MNKQLILIVLLFVGAVIAGRYLGESGPSDSVRLPYESCEPAVGPCIYKLPSGESLEFSLAPRHQIQPMQPLQAEVKVPEGWVAETVTMTGINMNMGVNNFKFRAAGGGVFAAEVILPACISDRMEWQAALKVVDGGRAYEVPFRFMVARR